MLHKHNIPLQRASFFPNFFTGILSRVMFNRSRTTMAYTGRKTAI